MTELYVKLTGCPYTATIEDVACFLAGCDIKGGKKSGIRFRADHIDQNRASGIAYVNLLTEDDVKLAKSKNKDFMGGRWIEVSEISDEDVENDIETHGVWTKSGGGSCADDDSFMVKMRGLPWSASPADIAMFFPGCDLKGGKAEAITIVKNEGGRPTGEAFVEFLTRGDKERALERDHEYMGRRYIEVSPSTGKAKEQIFERSEKNQKVSEAVVLLRGLPWSTEAAEIEEFFSACSIVAVQVVYDEVSERPLGEAFVEFSSIEDTEKAMTKFGDKIGSRYIEIFPSAKKHWTGTRNAADKSSFNQSIGAGGDRQRSRNPDAGVLKPPSRGARPGPYDRDMGYGGRDPYAGAMRGRVKLPQSTMPRGGGYDGGYGGGYDDGSRGRYQPDIQQYGRGGAMGGGAVGSANKHCVVVKGISCDVSVGDIIKLFASTVQPKNVEVKFGPGSMIGDAVVELETHQEAMQAMMLDKSNVAGVKVNLELASKPADYGSGYQAIQSMAPAQEDRYSSARMGGGYHDPYARSGARHSQGGYY